MDGAVHASASCQRGIRGIADGRDILQGNISLDNL
jgi:hypothetical protein